MTNKNFAWLTSCSFYIELSLDNSNDKIDGIFMNCQGLQRSQEVIQICEVTPQKWGIKESKGRITRTKIPGNDNSNNIILRRGLTYSTRFWDWFESVQQGNWAKQRHVISLNICNNAMGRQVQARYELDGAWPTNYTLADIQIDKTELAVEELEIAFEGMKRAPLPDIERSFADSL
ncbi:phage tail protein [Nostoc sp. FACHB-152]|uniref:phage tail protein n=1 Tax=unclassified Nostoc TaxID=2593658 RepID=UPI001689E7F0|nr:MULTISPECIES: phage tail protein [unclassified Nostoc]MBD2449752.1 phage tail protein [Nostoc sp. FACHB-152]MBD2469871.1 phage tail protein [Nostoc sp. FACHB-145]